MPVLRPRHAAGGSLRVVTKPAVDGDVAPGSVVKPGGSQDAFPGEACPFESSLLRDVVGTCDGLDSLYWCDGEQVVTELPLGAPSDTTSPRFRQHCDANVPAVSASTVSYGLPGDLPGWLVIHSDDKEPSFVAEVSIGVEPAPEFAYVGEPGPVETEYFPINSDPPKHLQVSFGDRSEGDTRRCHSSIMPHREPQGGTVPSAS